MTARRVLLLATLVVGMLLALGVGSAWAQLPPPPIDPPPTEPPPPPPPPVPTEDPEPEPTEEPPPPPPQEPEPEPTRTTPPPREPEVAPPSPTPSPSPSPTEQVPTGGVGVVPGFQVIVPPSEGGSGILDPVVAPPQPAPSPQPAPIYYGDGLREVSRIGTAGVAPLAAVMPGTFGIGLAAIIVAVLTFMGAQSLLRRGFLVKRTSQGEIDVERTRRWRSAAGLVLLALAGLIGVVGYLRISLETLVPVQVVYMASAGFAVIVFAVAGGALLVAEQLRADEKRISEIEGALTSIAAALRPAVQEAPRLLDRSGGSDADEDEADDVVVEDEPAEVASAGGGGTATATKTRTTRTATTRKPASGKAAAKKTTAKKAPAKKTTAKKSAAKKK